MLCILRCTVIHCTASALQGAYVVSNLAFLPLQEVSKILYNVKIPTVYCHILLGVYLPITLLGGVLNLVNLTIILSTTKLRLDPRNSFIVALALSDFFLCAFTAPLTLWSLLERHWPLGSNTEYLCKLVKAGQNFPIIMSCFCIGAIACDRFRFIMYPQRSQMSSRQVCFHVELKSIAKDTD